MKRTYDDIRAEATPCLGGCGKLCTHGPRYCRECLGKRADVAVGKWAPVSEWQTIDSAPRYVWVLVAWADRPTRQPQVAALADNGVWFDEDDACYQAPTLWAKIPPLPEPPK